MGLASAQLSKFATRASLLLSIALGFLIAGVQPRPRLGFVVAKVTMASRDHEVVLVQGGLQALYTGCS